MTRPFANKYARYYDLMYAKDKDYIRECDFLEQAFKRFSCGKIKTVLDFACGSGKHALELCRRGFNVEGVDISAAMIAVARSNSHKAKKDIPYYVSSMQGFKPAKEYDAVICMFAAFDYLLSDRDINLALRTINKCLKPGGILVMDFWNQDKFQKSFEQFRVKDIRTAGLRILRLSECRQGKLKDTLDMKINCLVLDKKRLVDEFVEVHSMRYFKAAQVSKSLTQAGLSTASITPFLKWHGSQEQAWSLSVVARKNK